MLLSGDDDEIIVVGRRQNGDPWTTTVRPEDWEAVGMTAMEYIFGEL